MVFKRIGAICFALAFILAIGVFTNYFSYFLSKSTAKYGIIIFGAIALLMNLLSFRYDSETENSNIIYWIGTVIVFLGLILKIQHFPWDQLVLVIGLGVIGLSYFYNPFQKKDENQNDDLLDG